MKDETADQIYIEQRPAPAPNNNRSPKDGFDWQSRNRAKGNEFGCIFRRGPDQNVEVAGVTRPSMKRETVRADDYVLNAAGV